MSVNNINRIFLGNEEIAKAYLGSEQIYPNPGPFHAQFDLSQGKSSTTLSLPISSNSNLRIDWGDGTETTGTNTHKYDTIGTYDVKIYGQFSFLHNNNAKQLMRIFNWGQFVIRSGNVFFGCSNLIIEDLETKVNVKATTNIQGLFRNCTSLTSIPLLDTSNVINMQEMFSGCSSLITVPELDTSKVTNMRYMFYGCKVLDVDLSGWCVPLIPSLPSNFVVGAPLMTAEKLPVWGTCP